MSYNINMGLPMRKFPPFFTGQLGIVGSDTALGLREHTTGKVFYVDVNHPLANTSNDGTSPDAPLSTITAALARCTRFSGDTILVAPNGRWQPGFTTGVRSVVITENVVVTVPGVQIIGLQKNGSGVRWDTSTTAGGLGGINMDIRVPDVYVAGFEFACDSAASSACVRVNTNVALGYYSDGSVIQFCKFRAGREVSLVGLHMLGADSITISNCEFVAVGTGILAAAAADATEPDLNFLLDCVFIANVTFAANLALWNYGTVKGNVFNAAGIGGALLDTVGGVTGMNFVAENYFSATLAGMAGVCTGHAADFWLQNYCEDQAYWATPA
jgi:hypothetical protein